MAAALFPWVGAPSLRDSAARANERRSPLAAIQANANERPAGTLEHGVLTLHLEVREGAWFPESDSGPSMPMDAFGEEGKALEIPGPLIRVREGTEIDLTIRNRLSRAAVVHGLHNHPGDSSDVLRLEPGAVRERRFTAGAAGTYAYWASAGGEMTFTAHGRPYREDSQVAGAFIVDPPSGSPPDRVFVLGLWRGQATEFLARQLAVINGKSWPYTERLHYRAGESVRWRWVNVSDAPHPMHLHGSYYRVQSLGDLEKDHALVPDAQPTVVTETLSWGQTMTMLWTPPAGRWVMHCHLLLHITPDRTVANALAADSDVGGDAVTKSVDELGHEGELGHMAGMALGITVDGRFAPVPVHGAVQTLRLLVRERPARTGSSPRYAYQLEEDGAPVPAMLTAPGPPIVLERGRPVEITVANELHEATTVHWHGVELESYYDGVAGWDGSGARVAPRIEPGHSFLVRFTPPRAGTFIYHTHLNDAAQLPGGLYGPLLVLEAGVHYDPDTDVVVLASRDGPDPLTAPLLLNGSTGPGTLQWRLGQRYRLRLINITPSNGVTFSLLGAGGALTWQAIAKDGYDLPGSQRAPRAASQVTLPGETWDYEFSPERAAPLTLEVSSRRLNARVAQPIEVR